MELSPLTPYILATIISDKMLIQLFYIVMNAINIVDNNDVENINENHLFVKLRNYNKYTTTF